MKYTQNYSLKKPEGTDTVNIDDLNANADIIDTELAKRIINSGGVLSIQAGLDAAKPAAGTAGRLYVATDTQVIYRDTGTAWAKVGVVKWGDIEGKPASFTPSAHKTTHATGGSDALTPADIGAETPAGAQAKADAVQANLNTHLADYMPHQSGLNSYASGVDANGIYTVVEYKRPDGTLYMKSTLSGGTSPNYTTDTWQFYDSTGTTVVLTKIWTLTYDADGKIISKVVA